MVIPEGATYIIPQAFSGFKNITSVIIPNSMQYIDQMAFQNCENISDIYCYAEDVPDLGYKVFENSYIEYTTLHVPASSIDAYKNRWYEFKKIVALTEDDPKPTGVNSIKADDHAIPTSIYSIDGKRLNTPKRGLNIIRMSDGTTKKLMVK